MVIMGGGMMEVLATAIFCTDGGERPRQMEVRGHQSLCALVGP